LKYTYCSEANASYLYIREGEEIARTETVLDGEALINFDKDVEGNIIGVEVIHPQED